MARTPTIQQKACVTAVQSALGMLKVEACAGSGKTSTLVMMAEACPVPSLYLAFNKVTANEAAEKFPKYVTCRTTHSVAYATYGKEIQHKLSRPVGKYVNVAGTGAEIGRFFKINPIVQAGETVLSQAYLGLLVKMAVALFEQSADTEIGMKHVPQGELNERLKTVTFDKNFVAMTVVTYARKLWDARIDAGSFVLATHDTYLKMYQLSKPVLAGFDILYVDEFQDTTPCVLDIVMQQKPHMKIVMVGDARQAIYGWRGAINAMKAVQCESKALTKSFRYGQAVADIATMVLEGAMVIEGNGSIDSVADFGCVDKNLPYTRLFRTNTALLTAAVAELKDGTPINIEIDVKDFVKLLNSAIALYEGDLKNVKHDKLLPFNDWAALIEEAKHDPELTRISKTVASGDASEWISFLENYTCANNPHVTFTTAHKSKGREFDQVIIEGDFKSCYNKDGEWVGLSEEEQNLLYVACTRAVLRLDYNQTVAEYIARWKSKDRSISNEFERMIRREQKAVRELIAA